MPTYEILNSYSITFLKKEISKLNKERNLFKGYSKMKKKEITELMVKHGTHFNHLTGKTKINVVKGKTALKKVEKLTKSIPKPILKKVETPTKPTPNSTPKPKRVTEKVFKTYMPLFRKAIKQDIKNIEKIIPSMRSNTQKNKLKQLEETVTNFKSKAKLKRAITREAIEDYFNLDIMA
tara:strand:+ start:2181 stop:2717 length:537 start_codon:yes stop_codon:yes gene_type:complete